MTFEYSATCNHETTTSPHQLGLTRMLNAVVIEPNPLLRHGLRACLSQPAYGTVAAFAVVDEQTPLNLDVDIIILGPGTTRTALGQLQLFRTIIGSGQRFRSVVLMDLADHAGVRQFAASGLDAVLSKDISPEVLLRSLDLVVLEQQIFPVSALLPPASQEMARTAKPLSSRLASRSAPVLTDLPDQLALSPREMQTLRGLAKGASNKIIAQQLVVAEATVKANVKSLLRKLKLANRTQAALWAINNQGVWSQPDGLRTFDQAVRKLGELAVTSNPASLQAAT